MTFGPIPKEAPQPLGHVRSRILETGSHSDRSRFSEPTVGTSDSTNSRRTSTAVRHSTPSKSRTSRYLYGGVALVPVTLVAAWVAFVALKEAPTIPAGSLSTTTRIAGSPTTTTHVAVSGNSVSAATVPTKSATEDPWTVSTKSKDCDFFSGAYREIGIYMGCMIRAGSLAR